MSETRKGGGKGVNEKDLVSPSPLSFSSGSNIPIRILKIQRKLSLRLVGPGVSGTTEEGVTQGFEDRKEV